MAGIYICSQFSVTRSMLDSASLEAAWQQNYMKNGLLKNEW